MITPVFAAFDFNYTIQYFVQEVSPIDDNSHTLKA